MASSSTSKEAVSMATEQLSLSNQSTEAVAAGEYLTAPEALAKQVEQVTKLPSSKSWPFGYGPLILSINAGLVGLVGNSFFRRMLMVRKGLFLTSIPTALIPGLIMGPAYLKLVTQPILLLETNCEICAQIKGGMVNFVLGAAYPILLAAPLSAALAKRYETIKLPSVTLKNFDRRHFVEFWMGRVRYFKGQFVTIAIFQTLFGMFVAGAQMRVSKKELRHRLVKMEH